MNKPVTKVNGQVVDATTQTDVMVVSTAPAMAMGSLYQNLSNSMSMVAINAMQAQQQAFIMHQAATVKNIKYLLGED